MRRQSRRRQLLVTSYTDFPDQYAELIERFARDKHVILGPMPRRRAVALQFQLSRWFGFLRQAPPDDEYAASLSAIAKTMQCSIINTTALNGQGEPLSEPHAILDWHLDPVTEYLRDRLTS